MNSADPEIFDVLDLELPLARVVAHPEFDAPACVRLRRFRAGEVIVREGDTNRSVYLVIAGEVGVEGAVRLQNGRQFQAGATKLAHGAVFGEFALFDQEPHNATVTALVAVQVIEVESTPLSTFLDSHRDLGYEVYRDLLHQLTPRLRKSNARVYRFLAWGLKAYRLDE
jgi:CRP-like cAMP-binding protein